MFTIIFLLPQMWDLTTAMDQITKKNKEGKVTGMYVL